MSMWSVFSLNLKCIPTLHILDTNISVHILMSEVKGKSLVDYLWLWRNVFLSTYVNDTRKPLKVFFLLEDAKTLNHVHASTSTTVSKDNTMVNWRSREVIINIMLIEIIPITFQIHIQWLQIGRLEYQGGNIYTIETGECFKLFFFLGCCCCCLFICLFVFLIVGS